MELVNSPVLVLNQNYQPLNICRVRRAVVLLLRGTAEALENGYGLLSSSLGPFPVPSVICLRYLVKRPYLQRRITRLEVFSRDKYTCQYCGRETRELTLDHVIPRRNGGEHVWENVVSACVSCNHRKAGRDPKEAGMKLSHKPLPPREGGFYVPYPYLKTRVEWQRYLPRD